MQELKDWFLENQREFPWRENRTPYRVWVSEVMLQQTRASVVVPYFSRWMEKYPTIAHLAGADIDDVIKSWEGLGYYSRARNLQAGAKQVMELYHGELPSNLVDLLKIKGLGHYTAGAILSFAFGQKAPALDGNVMRVLARYLGFEKDVIRYQRELRERLIDLLPERDAPIVMEGLIELGATICNKPPSCTQCPLRAGCKALAQDQTDLLPIKPKPKEVIELQRYVYCIISNGKVLVKKGKRGSIMAVSIHRIR